MKLNSRSSKVLVSKSTLRYISRDRYVNSKELREAREFYLYLNTMPRSTFRGCHPSDPLLDGLKSLISPPTVRKFRIAEKARYFLGKVVRKFSAQQVLRDDLPPSPPQPRPIRLRDPDRVIGVFYEHINKLH